VAPLALPAPSLTGPTYPLPEFEKPFYDRDRRLPHSICGMAAKYVTLFAAAWLWDRRQLNMSVRIVRLGSDRIPGEGLRIGTVRRPPRGVPKSEFASQNWYDVWFPNLAPSAETVKLAQDAQTDKAWAAFVKKYRAEMATPDNSRTLDLLAALSLQTDFSVGCYCADESRCHRSLLRSLLTERGADVADSEAP
jgi:uncharacterized protein YeaO (DUF488 family)